MKLVITAAALLCLGVAPAAAKSPCAEKGYKSASNLARSGVQKLAPPVPGAKAAVGKFYDGAQCVHLRGGEKIRDWAAERQRKKGY